MSYFHIDYGVLLARASDWSIRAHGFDDQGMADCIFRTAILIILIHEQNPELAEKLLIECWQLLHDKKRWPDDLNHDQVPGKLKPRSQGSMTRDPYIMTACATYVVTGGLNEHVKPVWWLYRPYLAAWMTYLRTGDRLFMGIYESHMNRILWWGQKTKGIRTFVENFTIGKVKPLRWTRHKFGIHTYSVHLWGWMAYIAKNKNIQDKLYKHVSDWNIGLRLLCGKFTAEWEIRTYVSVEGYRWTAMYWKDKDIIPLDEPYHLDKDVIEYLWNN